MPRGNGSITLAKLYDEIIKLRTDFMVEIGAVKERLTRMEAAPQHDSFQKNFCPNTKDIAEIKEVGTQALRNFENKHEEVHHALDKKLDEMMAEIKKIPEFYEKKLDIRDARARKAMWAGFIVILTLAVPAAIELIITWWG